MPISPQKPYLSDYQKGYEISNTVNTISKSDIQNMRPNKMTTDKEQFREMVKDETNDKTINQSTFTLNANENESKISTTNKAKSVFFYQSKYKYIEGKAAHKSEHITNIRNLCTMWPNECNGFQVNSKRAAFFLSSTSGQLCIVELNKFGRLVESETFSLINKSKITDFTFNPFNYEEIAIGKYIY